MRMLITAGVLGTLALAGTAALAAQKLGEVQPRRAPETVYAHTCGYCHGKNVGPIILGRQMSADVVTAMVRMGRGGMPAFRPSEITDAELADLSRWVEASQADAKEHGR